MEDVDLVEDDLKLDILAYLKIRERQLPVYKCDSPQIDQRVGGMRILRHAPYLTTVYTPIFDMVSFSQVLSSLNVMI